MENNLLNTNFVAYMNAYTTGSSGGDIVFIEIAKRFKFLNFYVVTSLLGKSLCTEKGLNAKFKITTEEMEFNNIYKTYLLRLIKGIFVRIHITGKVVYLATSDFFPDVLPVFLRKLFRRNSTWIQHIFHLMPANRKVVFITQRLSLLLIRFFADAVIVDNNILRDDLIGMGFIPKKVYTNYLGIRHFTINESVTTKSYEASFMARLKPYKGIYDVINIWEKVVNKIPNARLAVLGKGETHILLELKEMLKNKKLDQNVDLLGYLPDSQAFSIIQKSKLFLFPSHEEGFGLVGLEAQTNGVPIVAWNLPVFNEIFKDGMIQIEENNIKLFAEKVCELLLNENYRDSLSVSAINNAKKYSWDTTAENEFRIINTLINKEYEN